VSTRPLSLNAVHKISYRRTEIAAPLGEPKRHQNPGGVRVLELNQSPVSKEAEAVGFLPRKARAALRKSKPVIIEVLLQLCEVDPEFRTMG
jgi:hypothetical protein